MENKMLNINEKKVCAILDKIIAHELSGVIRYTHYSLMVHGLERLSLVGLDYSLFSGREYKELV